MQSDVTDLAVVVTGAASGLGRAAALAFAAGGAKVFAVDVNEEGLAETREMTNGNICTHTADLSDPANCPAIIDKAIEELGSLDALCNIAGVMKLAPVDKVTPESWDLTYNVNVRAPFFLSQAALPHLKDGGAIVNVSSATAFKGHAYLSAYTSSKAAVAHMTKSMATEFVKSGIKINAIAPGMMTTPMTEGAEIDKSVDMDLMARTMGFRPSSDPEELTQTILYLASKQNTIFHGAVLNIDAGFAAG